MMNDNSIDVANVVSVYSGRDGKCCCGCSGTHYQAAERPDMVRRIVNTINRHIAAGFEADVDATYTAVVIGRRLYIAYTA